MIRKIAAAAAAIAVLTASVLLQPAAGYSGACAAAAYCNAAQSVSAPSAPAENSSDGPMAAGPLRTADLKAEAGDAAREAEISRTKVEENAKGSEKLEDKVGNKTHNSAVNGAEVETDAPRTESPEPKTEESAQQMQGLEAAAENSVPGAEDANSAAESLQSAAANTVQLQAAARMEYTLTFAVNGGSALESIKRPYGSVVYLGDYRPVRPGYYFAGWYADPAYTVLLTRVILDRDRTIYARWRYYESVPPMPFYDVKDSDWFYADVGFVYGEQLMEGTSRTSFSPYLGTTRAMLVTLLYRLDGSSYSGRSPFSDVPAGIYYDNAVSWAAANGIVNGYGDGRFGPDDAVTREQIAAAFYRYAAYKGFDVSQRASLGGYGDGGSVSPWAVDAVQWASGTKLMQGDGSNLMPAAGALRCEIAALLHRFIRLYV